MSVVKEVLRALSPASSARKVNVTPDDVRKHGGVSFDDPSSTVLAYLLAGPLTLGGIGYGVDRWLGIGFMTPIGILAGVALALYIIVLRFGRS